MTNKNLPTNLQHPPKTRPKAAGQLTICAQDNHRMRWTWIKHNEFKGAHGEIAPAPKSGHSSGAIIWTCWGRRHNVLSTCPRLEHVVVAHNSVVVVWYYALMTSAFISVGSDRRGLGSEVPREQHPLEGKSVYKR